MSLIEILVPGIVAILVLWLVLAIWLCAQTRDKIHDMTGFTVEEMPMPMGWWIFFYVSSPLYLMVALRQSTGMASHVAARSYVDETVPRYALELALLELRRYARLHDLQDAQEAWYAIQSKCHLIGQKPIDAFAQTVPNLVELLDSHFEMETSNELQKS